MTIQQSTNSLWGEVFSPLDVKAQNEPDSLNRGSLLLSFIVSLRGPRWSSGDQKRPRSLSSLNSSARTLHTGDGTLMGGKNGTRKIGHDACCFLFSFLEVSNFCRVLNDTMNEACPQGVFLFSIHCFRS